MLWPTETKYLFNISTILVGSQTFLPLSFSNLIEVLLILTMDLKPFQMTIGLVTLR